MRCGYNQYCLHCHFLEYWNTNSMSGKGTFTCQKEAKKMETSDNNTISIQNYGSSFWSGSCEPDLTNFKFIGEKIYPGIHVGRYIWCTWWTQPWAGWEAEDGQDRVMKDWRPRKWLARFLPVGSTYQTSSVARPRRSFSPLAYQPNWERDWYFLAFAHQPYWGWGADYWLEATWLLHVPKKTCPVSMALIF